MQVKSRIFNPLLKCNEKRLSNVLQCLFIVFLFIVYLIRRLFRALFTFFAYLQFFADMQKM